MTPMDRFKLSLNHCARLRSELNRSAARVRSRSINAEWVASLDGNEAEMDMVVAYISRFSRFQDAIADSLIPKWLEANDERVGAAAENFSKAAKLGIIDDIDELRAARSLRNKLTHEYVDDREEFASLLTESLEYVDLLVDCFNRISDFAQNRMGLEVSSLT